MICQECGERPSTLHFTKVVNGEKNEIHLCQKCAQEKHESLLSTGGDMFSVNNLIAGLLNMSAFPQQNPSASHQNIQCENCSMTYEQFVNIGKFGCHHCYETFSDKLQPILKRLHSGNLTHKGKVPARQGGTIHLKRKVSSLRQTLQELVSNEEFEKAAELRDEIRSLESTIFHERGDS
ncbi:UvrB/UvrC motif-containing protein [Bacillus sp. 2205SS5-2]|uniref:UvrB/UvrC motif-containing protein n=1 Tax=Bacillus sp. 2205SS5-2 TaxID=3109031 RepID=UPI0030053CBB